MKTQTAALTMITMPPLIMTSSKSWFFMWILMEINTIGFIYWLTNMTYKSNIINFYIFQCLASILIFLSFSWNILMTGVEQLNNWKILFMVSIMLKIGMFPFHLWPIEITKMISWLNNFILMTWQKLIPLVFFMKTKANSMCIKALMIPLFFLSTMLLNFSTTKVSLMVSSLIHTTWIMCSFLMKTWVPFFYLTMYSIILAMIIKALKKYVSVHNPINNPKNKMNLVISMMSLSGIPPLMGFMPKWFVINMLLKSLLSKTIPLFMLIMASTSFFIYMMMTSNTMILNKNMKQFNPINEKDSAVKNMNFLTFITMLLL